MALGKGQKKKQAARAQELLPDAVVTDYALAKTGPYPVNATLGTVAGYVGLVVAIAALTGILVYPGAIFVIIVANLINPPRALAVTDLGVASLKRSAASGIVNGRPTAVLARMGRDVLRNQVIGRRGKYHQIQLGGENLWVKSDDYVRLVGAVALSAPQGTPTKLGV